MSGQPYGGLRKWGTPNIDPQIVGFPYNQDPKKVPSYRKPPYQRGMFANSRKGGGESWEGILQGNNSDVPLINSPKTLNLKA